MSTIGAVVAYAPEGGQMKWKHEQIAHPRQPKEKELLIRMASVGICHTDVFVSNIPSGVMGVAYPKILGHEGAGYVEAVGPGVTVAAVGDPVLLSYTYCKTCDLCTNDDQTYCENFALLNVVGEPNLFKSNDAEGSSGKFFGQSSFAAMSVVDEQCVVNVKDSLKTSEELQRCAPLGCGLMTGAGTALKYIKAHDILVVTGLGAVGMGAIMAAKIAGAKAIVAVDRVDSRIEIAKEIGATHTYNTAGKELSSFVADIRALVDDKRISYGIETTGYTPLAEQMLLSLGKRGKLLQIGVPAPGSTITLPQDDFFHQTKSYEVNFLGDVKAQEFLPKMIQWYKEGRFPIDKIIKFYPVDKVLDALHDMHADVIKPILVF